MQICPFKLVCQSRALPSILQGLTQENKKVLEDVASVLLSEPAAEALGGKYFFLAEI